MKVLWWFKNRDIPVIPAPERQGNENQEFSDSLSHMMSPETHRCSEDTGDLIFTVPVLILQAGLLGRKALDDLKQKLSLT